MDRMYIFHSFVLFVFHGFMIMQLYLDFRLLLEFLEDPRQEIHAIFIKCY